MRAEPIAVPRKSSAAIIAPREISSRAIASVLAIWQAHAGDHDMPNRDAVLPKPMAPFMRHISLIRWIADEDDYEARFIGDAHVQAYGETTPAGHRLSAMIASRPAFGKELRRSYDTVRTRRTPLIMRGFIGRDFADARFVWFETIYLPLRGGADDVEFVMNAAVYQPRDGAWPPN